MTEEKIARINELYHKSKSEGLTADEKKEQAVLRRGVYCPRYGGICGRS